MIDTGYSTAVNVVMQGGPRVQSVDVVHFNNYVTLLTIDLHSKYCGAQGVSDGGEEQGPLIELTATEDSAFLLEDSHEPTFIELPEFKGWGLFAVEANGRYSVSVCLKRN